jgi:hypothetical protein
VKVLRVLLAICWIAYILAATFMFVSARHGRAVVLSSWLTPWLAFLLATTAAYKVRRFYLEGMGRNGKGKR